MDGEYDFPVVEMVSICEEWLQEFCHNAIRKPKKEIPESL